MTAVLLVIRLSVLLGFFLAFRRLERRNRGVAVVLTVLGVAIADAVLYPDTTSSAERSIFHPDFLGQSFRLTQLVVPLALAARLSVQGWPRRIDASAPLWLAFFLWVGVSTVAGLLEGHDAGVALRQTAIIVHVGGGMALAATVPVWAYVTGSAVPRFIHGCAVAATALFVWDTFGSPLSINAIPDLPLPEVGRYGADAATLFSSVGVLGLVLAVSRPKGSPHRVALLVSSVVLLLSHVASAQRAARLGLYVILILLLLVCCTPTARRRIRVKARQVAMAGSAVLAAILAVIFTTALLTAAQMPTPEALAAEPGAGPALGPTTRQGSIQSRYNQWQIARQEIVEAPFLGHGLGVEVSYYEVAEGGAVTSDITHNIVLDLLLRTGLVGVALAASAVLVVWWRGILTWRWHPDNRVAAWAIAAVTLSAGLLAKGLVESIFEKHRLALLLGVVIGLAISAATSGPATQGLGWRLTRTEERRWHRRGPGRRRVSAGATHA